MNFLLARSFYVMFAMNDTPRSPPLVTQLIQSSPFLVNWFGRISLFSLFFYLPLGGFLHPE